MILLERKNGCKIKNQKHFLLLILFVATTIFLSGCINLLDPSKIRIITSRARNHRRSKVVKAIPQVGEIIVKKGDTVYGISRNYDVPVRTLIEHNRLSPPYILKIGQKLRLPPSPFHIVQKGDTLYSISHRYDVELASLTRVNNIKAPYNIYLNQKLILPGSIEPQKEEALPSQAVASKPNSKSSSKNSSKIKTPTPKSKPSPNIPRPDARSSNKFAWPLRGNIVSNFGSMGKGQHNDGMNITATQGTPVLASENGVVAYTGSQLKSFGNLLLIKHDSGYMTAYAHNDTIIVKRGEKIKRGQKIATVGQTGSVTSPQLHFEIRKGTKALDPKLYLER